MTPEQAAREAQLFLWMFGYLVAMFILVPSFVHRRTVIGYFTDLWRSVKYSNSNKPLSPVIKYHKLLYATFANRDLYNNYKTSYRIINSILFDLPFPIPYEEYQKLCREFKATDEMILPRDRYNMLVPINGINLQSHDTIRTQERLR